MKRIHRGSLHCLLHAGFTFVAALVICCTADWAFADQVQMRNGDQYFGNVVSLSKDTLIIQSDVLGTIHLPRAKVAFVNFGASAPAQPASVAAITNYVHRLPAPALTNNPGDVSATLQQLGGNSNVLHEIEAQYLSDAGPEAKAKFNELLGGYLSGKLSVNDIRAQAQSAADQVRSLRKDLGEDAGSMIDGYLAILDTFLKETAPPAAAAKTPPPASQKPKPSLPEDE